MTDKRVRTGCATCRRRRIKCDETKPICNRCRNANFQCEGYAAPRRLSNTSSASRSVLSKRTSPSASPPSSSSPSQWSNSNSASPPDTSSFPEISLRHKDWRREQLPLYHHFVTTTVVRLFRQDHVAFWRDEVVQMSHEMDLVYEALLAVGAIHRSSLIACQAGNGPQALRFKLFGFRSYGKVMQMLPRHLLLTSVPDIFASLVVLMLLAYFECFLENPKAAFRHLWAAILLFRSSEERFSEEEMSSAIPIFDAMLRLDFLAQTLVPYAGSSFLRTSKQAIMESPFWNRPDPLFLGCTQLDAVAAERYRLLQLVGAHNKLTRIVWGCLFPPNEWPSREEMTGFHDEMLLWKATSPATFKNYDASDEIGLFDALALNTASALHIAAPSNLAQAASLSDPQPQFFASNEAALNAALCNDYLISALSMLSSCDKDPIARELEAYSLVYQNLCIAAGLIERHKYWANAKTPYKPCDAVSMGITTFLFHGARRCYSRAWQKWTISALRRIGREGLSNGHTCANAVEILLVLQDEPQYGNMDADDEYLGPLRDRVMPLLMPRGEEDLHLAFYLRHGQVNLGEDEGAVQVLAKATWRQESDGTMHSLKLDRYDLLGSSEQPKALDLFASWRPEVGNGWHGYLSNEIQDGFLRKECPLSTF